MLRYLADSEVGLKEELLETWRRGLTQYAKLHSQEVRTLTSHWSRSFGTVLSLVGIMMLLMPALLSFHAQRGSFIGALMLCHKDTAKSKKCLELCLYDIIELASATSRTSGDSTRLATNNALRSGFGENSVWRIQASRGFMIFP